MKPVTIIAKEDKFRGVCVVVVNGQELTSRHHAKYANERACAFALYLKKQGHVVHLTLIPKAV